MTTISISMFERFQLWNICGAHQVPTLKEASVFLRLIEKFRFSDAEMRETNFTQEENRYRWTPPVPGYGHRHVELEDEEAKALKSLLEGMPVRVADAEWMLKLTEQLSVQPQKRKKNAA